MTILLFINRKAQIDTNYILYAIFFRPPTFRFGYLIATQYFPVTELPDLSHSFILNFALVVTPSFSTCRRFPIWLLNVLPHRGWPYLQFCAMFSALGSPVTWALLQ